MQATIEVDYDVAWWNAVVNATNGKATISSPTNERLNIVLTYPDDWRHDSLQDANPQVHTPFLSKLAQRGIRFSHNAVTTSICWISRATLYTGRYASMHNFQRLYCPIHTLSKYWQHTWVAHLQKDANYFVGHVGK